MSAATRLKSAILTCALALAIGGTALALNPQPEPPMPYRGFEYVITLVSPNEWRWEIRKPSAGQGSQVLESGIVRGNHFQAIKRARTAIDQEIRNPKAVN